MTKTAHQIFVTPLFWLMVNYASETYILEIKYVLLHIGNYFIKYLLGQTRKMSCGHGNLGISTTHTDEETSTGFQISRLAVG